MEADIGAAFLAQVVRTSAGQAHLLSISVEAEEGDEADVFGQLEGLVDDPKLRTIVRRHRTDEERHARLFRACLDRLGLEKQPVPDELRIIRQVAAASGREGAGVHTADDALGAYAVLFAIEERGVEQFPLIAHAFRRVDPATAAIYEQVTRDERGHLLYCQKLGRHFAADEATWQTAVTFARALEESAFLSVGMANLAYCADQGWVDLDALLGAAPAEARPPSADR